MEEVRLRLIYPERIGREKREAAYRGLERLKPFGVLCEQADSSEQMWDVRAGGRIKEIVASRLPVAVGRYDFQEGLLDLIADSEIFGVGITDQRIFLCGENARREVLSLGRERVGAVVSLAGIGDRAQEGSGAPYRSMPSSGDPLKAAELAVARAAGMIFLQGADRPGKGCGAPDCLMRECASALELLESVSRARLGFCRSCEAEIGRGISAIQFPY